MPYQEQAHIIFKYLRAKFPRCSIGHRWDDKLDCEWYFLQYKKLRIRLLVPKIFLQANSRDKLESKLDALDLNGYIRSGRAHYIVIDNSGLDVHAF